MRHPRFRQNYHQADRARLLRLVQRLPRALRQQFNRLFNRRRRQATSRRHSPQAHQVSLLVPLRPQPTHLPSPPPLQRRCRQLFLRLSQALLSGTNCLCDNICIAYLCSPFSFLPSFPPSPNVIFYIAKNINVLPQKKPKTHLTNQTFHRSGAWKVNS